MASLLAIFLALLVPVVALLFLNLRFSRKLDYSHHLVEAANRSGPAAFLFRSFRTYYDIIMDAFIAFVLAMAMAGELGLPAGFPFKPSREAVVVDCSASMLLGRNGRRPLDLAIAWLDKAGADGEVGDGSAGTRNSGDGSGVGSVDRRKKAEVFALSFDPLRGQTRLVRLDSLIHGASGDVAVTRLVENLSFLGIDYGALARLGKEGYGKITFLTDGLSPGIRGVETVRLGGQTPGVHGAGSSSVADPVAETLFSAWPSSIRFDREKGNWLAAFVQSLPPSSIGLERWDEARGIFARLDAGTYRIEPRESGWAFRIPQPGIYRATMIGPSGEGPLYFTFRLVEARRAGLASGSFSEAMMSVFPLVERAPRPSLLFLDRGSGTNEESRRLDAAARDRAARNPGALTMETRIRGQDGEHYLPPAITGGRPILAEAESPGEDKAGDRPRSSSGRTGWFFELGPAALANPDLPLAYDGVLAAAAPPAFLVAPRNREPGTDLDRAAPGEGSAVRALPLRGLIRKGRSFFVEDEHGLLPVIPPSDEYFPAAALEAPGSGPAIAAPLPPVALWTALLGLAAIAKILVWKKLGGGRQRPLDT